MHAIFAERERAHNDCICISHPSLFTTGTLEPRRLERDIYSLGHVSKSAANASEYTRVLSLARFHIDMTARQRVKMKISAFRINEPLSAQESHGHDVIFPSHFDDEGHLLWTDPKNTELHTCTTSGGM